MDADTTSESGDDQETGDILDEENAGKADEPRAASCGNGVVEAGEACDGSPCCTNACQFFDPQHPVVESAVNMAGGGHPRATRLSDGRFVGVYEHVVDGQLRLSAVESRNGGSSWSPLGVVASEPNTPGRTLANPQVVQLPNGTLLTAFRHHDPGANGATNYRLLVSASSDGGRTWGFRGQIEVYGSHGLGVWEPFLFVTPQGRLQVYYAKERTGALQDVLVRDSANDGASWGPARVVASLAGSREGMPGVTALNDGSIVVIFESFRQPGVNNTFVVRTVQSNDGGQSWHHRRNVYVHGPSWKNAGAPQIATLADGRLVATFMSDGPSTATNWPNNAATYMMVSRNVPSFGDIDWDPNPIQITGVASFWPGLVQARLRNPIVLYSQGGAKSAAVCL